MLLDPSLVTDLSTSQGAQTLAFVKRVLAGLSYVDMQLSGSTITCQVKTGDGTSKIGVQDIMIKLGATETAVPPALPTPPTVSASVGTIKAGSGSSLLWAQTNSSGALTVTVSGTGSILVEMTPNQGVSMFVGIG